MLHSPQSEVEEMWTNALLGFIDTEICFTQHLDFQKYLNQLRSIWQNVNPPPIPLSESPISHIYISPSIFLPISSHFFSITNKTKLQYLQISTSFSPSSSSPLLSLFPSPPHFHSPINTKQSFHILRWREKTTRKMTSVPEKSKRNGVKVRVGQRSWREKVGRKEGGWEREDEREHE